jgi:hypothetical protein
MWLLKPTYLGEQGEVARARTIQVLQELRLAPGLMKVNQNDTFIIAPRIASCCKEMVSNCPRAHFSPLVINRNVASGPEL